MSKNVGGFIDAITLIVCSDSIVNELHFIRRSDGITTSSSEKNKSRARGTRKLHRKRRLPAGKD